MVVDEQYINQKHNSKVLISVLTFNLNFLKKIHYTRWMLTYRRLYENLTVNFVRNETPTFALHSWKYDIIMHPDTWAASAYLSHPDTGASSVGLSCSDKVKEQHSYNITLCHTSCLKKTKLASPANSCQQTTLASVWERLQQLCGHQANWVCYWQFTCHSSLRPFSVGDANVLNITQQMENPALQCYIIPLV